MRWRLLSILLLALTAAFAIASWRLMQWQAETSAALLQQALRSTAQAVASELADSVWTGEADLVQPKLAAAIADLPYVDGAEVMLNEHAERVAVGAQSASQLSTPVLVPRKQEQAGTLVLHLNANVEELRPALPLANLFVDFAVAVLFGLVIGWLALRPMLRAVTSLRNAADRFAQGDLGTPVAVFGPAELGRLQHCFELARQSLARAQRLKDRFTAAMNHELRTPIGNAVAGLELLDVSPLSAEQRELVHIARAELLRGVRLTEELLTYARASSGAITPTLEAVDVMAVTREVIEGAQLRAPSSIGIAISGHVPPVQTDPALLGMMLSNLLTNALKHAKAKQITVQLSYAHDQLAVTVVDDGVGIPAELLPHIFEPFRQGGHGEGFGLGLALVRSAAEAMSGRCDVRLRDSGGTAFEIVLPVVTAQLEPSYVHASPAPVPTPVLPPLPDGVLIVDDNPIGRDLLAQLCWQPGRRVPIHTAASGAEAIEYALAERPQLILLDVSLLDMDGFDVVKVLRGVPDYDPKIVAISADASDDLAARCAAAGFDDLVRRPYTVETLGPVVRSVLAGERFADA